MSGACDTLFDDESKNGTFHSRKITGVAGMWCGPLNELKPAQHNIC
jgi:hypothetical protein